MHSSSIVGSAILAGLVLCSHALAQDPSYTQFGSGCPGRVGVPILKADAGYQPMLGGMFRAQLSNVPDGPAIGILGLSTTRWGNFALPLDLGSDFMPGCTLYTDLRRTTTLDIVGGRATWDTVMPSSPEWLGRSFVQQVFVFDSTMPGMGAVMSNAAVGVIGLADPAPVATIAFPPPNSWTDEDTILVRGTATDPDGVAEVRVNDLLATTSDDFLNWQVRVPIVPGANTLTVATRDMLGEFDPEAATARIKSQIAFESLRGVTIDLPGNRALVTDSDRNAVFAIDLATGDRSVISDANRGAGPGLSFPVGLALDGTRALVVDSSLAAVIAIDLDTGDRTVLSDASTGTGPAFVFPTGIALDGTRALVVGGNRILAVDLDTGDRTVLSDNSTGTGQRFQILRAITMDETRALVTDVSLDGVIAVDLATGNRTLISRFGSVGSGPRFLFSAGIALEGTRALVTDQSSSAVIAVDLLTGHRTVLSDNSTGTGPGLGVVRGIALNGTRAVIVEESKVVFVNLATGNRAVLSDDSPGTGPGLLNPLAIALNGTRALVVDGTARAVFAVDLATGDRTVLSDASTGSGRVFVNPRGITVGTGRALVTDNTGIIFRGRVYSVDLATGNRMVLSDAGTGSGKGLGAPWGIILDGDRALIADPVLGAINAIDLETGDRIVLSDAHTGSGFGCTQTFDLVLDGTRALVTDRLLGRVFAVDLATGNRTAISDGNTGMGPRLVGPEGITIDPSRSRVLVVDRFLPAIIAIDLATGDRSVLSGASAGIGPAFRLPRGIALDGTRALVTDSSGQPTRGMVFAVDIQTGERVILSR